MALTTYEGVVERGKIRLKAGVRLPENAKVYVIVPEMQAEKKKDRSRAYAAFGSPQTSLRF